MQCDGTSGAHSFKISSLSGHNGDMAENTSSDRPSAIPGVSITRAPDPVQARVQALEDSMGSNRLVDWACRLLMQETEAGAESDPDIELLGGMEPVEDWMPRVWAGQALLYVWHRTAEHAVIAGLSDEVWQVQVVSAQVAGVHHLTQLVPQLMELFSSPHPQLRSTVARVLGGLASTDDDDVIEALGSAVMSTDSVLADAADEALSQLADRFDQPNLRASPKY